MSLDWNCEKVTGWETLRADETENARLAYFCWELMRVGIGSVTKENVQQVWKRIDVAQKLDGALLQGWENGEIAYFPYTEADVEKYVGYSTNVTTVTNAEWAKSFVASRL
jgi:hypothetical protein